MTETALQPEDQARANLYALLARLFYGPPDRELLASLAGADELLADDGRAPLAAAWRELTAAAAAMGDEAAREEYEGVFVGTGKAEVTLYTGAYTVKTMLDNPLVEIREFLAAHGFVRRENVSEPEDHLAALCETMRHLVAVQGSSAAQQRFFRQFIWPAADALCDAIAKSPNTNFYKRVGNLARSFFALEHGALELD
ncbi:MAG: TorD/DmsD family molecular chaperone [Burkholderiales bacterium]